LPRHLATPARYGGLLHVSRRQLALTATVFAGAMALVNTTPADAAPLAAEAQMNAPLQSLTVPAEVLAEPATRDGFSMSYFTVITWPLGAGVTMSADFGPRNAPCSGCSSNHQGIDWTPGSGTPIQSIADGVVVEAGDSSGGLGTHIKIQHTIDGQTWTSVYGHMISGSRTLNVGDSVEMGQQVGQVGNTGASTGAHLHFEIRDAGGSAVDPYAWLSARANV
jgi:murein DD-endopeptidase MepM/ murein hydrolase activator NlpD